jgi:hypothetical protein
MAPPLSCARKSFWELHSHSIRKAQEIQKEVELNGIYLVVCTDDINLLGENIYAI